MKQLIHQTKTNQNLTHQTVNIRSV